MFLKKCFSRVETEKLILNYTLLRIREGGKFKNSIRVRMNEGSIFLFSFFLFFFFLRTKVHGQPVSKAGNGKAGLSRADEKLEFNTLAMKMICG